MELPALQWQTYTADQVREIQRAAAQAALEAAAKVCDRFANSAWDDCRSEAWSDEFELCAAAIRAIQVQP